MKTLDLNFDYEREDINLGDTKPAVVFTRLFQQLVDSVYQQGMSFKDSHVLYKIFNKLEKVSEDLQVELEDSEYEFAKKVVREGKFTSQQTKVAHLIYEAFELTD